MSSTIRKILSDRILQNLGRLYCIFIYLYFME